MRADRHDRGSSRIAARRCVVVTILTLALVALGGFAAAAEDQTNRIAPSSPAGSAVGTPLRGGESLSLSADSPQELSARQRGQLERLVTFTDTAGDSGDAADILSQDVSHVDDQPGTAADDRIQLLSIFSNPGCPVGLCNGDLLQFFLNTDGNALSGDPVVAPVPLGAEYLVEVAVDGSRDAGLFRWNGAGYSLARSFSAPADYLVVDDFGDGSSGIIFSMPMAELGLARGGSVSFVELTAFDFRAAGPDIDFAGNGPPHNSVTLPPPPERPGVGAVSASGVGPTSATLSGSVDPNRLASTYRFQYGLTTRYDAEAPVPAGGAGAGDAAVPVSAAIGGLVPGTTYNYRLCAVNAAGETCGGNATVTSLPLAQTGAARRIRRGSLDLAGVATANGTAQFEWGRSERRLTRMTPAVAVAGEVPVTARLRGLRPGTRYYYRLVATAGGQRVGGQILSAVTAARPVIEASIEARDRCRVGADSCQLRNFLVIVRRVDPRTDRVLRPPSALRGARVSIRCSRGCSLGRAFRLRVGGIPIANAANRPVTIRVRRASGGLSFDLSPLFPILSRRWEFQLVIRKSGLQTLGSRVSSSSRARVRTCEVRGDRLVRCRRPS